MNKKEEKEIKVGKQIEQLIHQEMDKRLNPLENEMRFYSDRLCELDDVLSDMVDAYGKVTEVEANIDKLSEIVHGMTEMMDLKKSIGDKKVLSKQIKEKKDLTEEERAKLMVEETPVSTQKIGETSPKGKPEWEDVQIGDLDKGEKRIWRYGTHILTIWREKDGDHGQINDSLPVFVHRDKDFQKLKRQVMKLKQ